MTAIPAHHDDITVEWLNEVLHDAGESATVESFERRPMSEGVGMMATIEMLDLAYADGEGPETVVVKLPATNEANLGVALAFDLYRREALFYRDIAERTSASTPKMFFADATDAERFALVMEDLRAYRLGDQVQGCGLEDAMAAMTTLGELHAPFWDRVDRPEFEFIPYETPSTHGDALRDGSRAGWDPMVETFGDAVPEPMRAVRDRFLQPERGPTGRSCGRTRRRCSPWAGCWPSRWRCSPSSGSGASGSGWSSRTTGAAGAP